MQKSVLTLFYRCTLFSYSDFIIIIIKGFWRTHVLFWSHWYTCFGFLVMSHIRKSSALFTFCGGECNVHSPKSTSGAAHCKPLDSQHHTQSILHMHQHQQRWELARILTSNHLHRRRTHYHSASNPAGYSCTLFCFFQSYRIQYN